MSMKQLNVERLSIVSDRPFQKVVSAIEEQIGHPDLRKLLTGIAVAKSDDEVKALINSVVGPTNLMEFLRLDQGDMLRKELGENAPQVLRLLVGNPLTMRKMVKVVPDAGSYAPVTILIDERPDGVHISYDRMASLLAPYESEEALKVARDLDATVENVLRTAANPTNGRNALT